MTKRALLPLLTLAVLLGGCDRQLNQMRETRFAPFTPVPQATVAPSALMASLKASGNGSFTAESLDNLNSLLHAQGRLHNQHLTLQPYTPSGDRLAQRLASVLRDQGAAEVSIRPTRLDASEARDWDLQVVSEAIVAKIPDCSVANAKTWTVKPFEAVGQPGCAVRANIAAMVADPRDLARPRTLDSADGIHAVGAMQRYHEDEVRELLDIDFQD
ncbi:CpaD family pilus assembly protein [Pseudomonas fakonensis]|uniref:CpaD family pilus assembly protein n=1 Tax=Pseudomonas fakonensis TaxID=2842355 RepID=A0ABX8NC07_9PSED|nr:CpaD family pilus assembly lipoprotein [Pseudomonas fakonensis]QXH53534.1 CpaD family pilus assembly protein [Pseudomonas fakonensis]